VLGIGGGGDVVGALASLLLCERLGTPAVLGGVTWERRPIDPVPGPRRASEIVGAHRLGEGVLRAGPRTRTKEGVLFAESRMAAHRGEDTLLVDPNVGPSAIADGLIETAGTLGADLAVLVDVGGDVLGDGSEPGLASPLCDAVLLAAGIHLQARGMKVAAAVFGPCCDGELTLDELLDHLARLGAAGALLGTDGLTRATADELDRACAAVPTEASAQAVRCARGEIGIAPIRGGRRHVPLSPIGALTFYFDPGRAVPAVARLAGAVRDAGSLEEANEALHALGVRTELDYELEMAAG
jgi:hypothetical protein